MIKALEYKRNERSNKELKRLNVTGALSCEAKYALNGKLIT